MNYKYFSPFFYFFKPITLTDAFHILIFHLSNFSFRFRSPTCLNIVATVAVQVLHALPSQPPSFQQQHQRGRIYKKQYNSKEPLRPSSTIVLIQFLQVLMVYFRLFFIFSHSLSLTYHHFCIITPHFIAAYEKGHQRPPLTVYTFQAPEQSLSQPVSPVTSITPTENNNKMIPPRSPTTSIKSLQNKPPLPTVRANLFLTLNFHSNIP